LVPVPIQTQDWVTEVEVHDGFICLMACFSTKNRYPTKRAGHIFNVQTKRLAIPPEGKVLKELRQNKEIQSTKCNIEQ